MFSSARIKLTLWYLLIITLITAAFSVSIYRGFTREFDRLRVQRQRIPATFLDLRRTDEEMIQEAQERLRLTLLIIDFLILSGSAVAAYFLAGRTLQPIEKMVEEQKRFIADASHELRTPLTSLKSEIEVSLRDKRLTLTEAKKMLVSNLEEVDKLKALSDYLLSLSRYQTSDLNLNLEEIKLSQIINPALDRVRTLAKTKSINLKSVFKELSLQGNSQSLTELLVILLENAIKFSPRNSRVLLKVSKEGDQVIIKVVDNGGGITEEDLPFIFNRFYQADASRTKQELGYGLGLSIAKRITELHHGTIEAESVIGKGSTFSVKLPLKNL